MTAGSAPQRILLVTGLSGAGKSTALRTLEDLGWEVVDNLPLSLLEDLLETPLGKGKSRRRRPLALGVDSRTRDFDANRIVQQIKALASEQRVPVETLYFDCAGSELLRRYSETRRRLELPVPSGVSSRSSSSDKGKLSTTSQPRSSRVLSAVDLPAPDRPVTSRIRCGAAPAVKGGVRSARAHILA